MPTLPTRPVNKERRMPMAQRSSSREAHAGPAASPVGADGAFESDHRIANNLQLLMAMIAAERRDIVDPAAALALERMLGRIGAIAGVHRQLTRPQESGMVEIGGYLQTLALQIEAGCCDVVAGRQLRVASDTALVPARLAAAIGLIASECVLNACKYAYHAQEAGEVRIVMRLASAHALRFSVEDDGIGSGSPEPGFGTRLIEMLAARIGAALIRENTRPGTRIVLAVPLR
ncbi:sensor histidine kinase [Novosphingobium barchaimii]|nr:sensor histidine kinase [Novosphingobium barchaimii]